ncbi:hypothetical protein HAX54_050515 [Datura stramonium]|uniref:Uncharacterized protein n=1 Tax=Datura stramonium TaxID=4076 RepID=A0ABS8WQB2_DATST|nr:hypothetical protein [Datura stramonium]
MRGCHMKFNGDGSHCTELGLCGVLLRLAEKVVEGRERRRGGGKREDLVRKLWRRRYSGGGHREEEEGEDKGGGANGCGGFCRRMEWYWSVRHLVEEEEKRGYGNGGAVAL